MKSYTSKNPESHVILYAKNHYKKNDLITDLKRIYSLAVKEQLRNFLMSDAGFIPIEDAIKEADKKWPR